MIVRARYVRGRRVRDNTKPCYRWSERKQCWILTNPEDVRCSTNMPLKVWPSANIWLMPIT